MEHKGEDFLALQEYVTAKATLLERLGNMEEKRGMIKPAIFEKIRSDYERQLRELIDGFRTTRIQIIKKLGSMEGELGQIEKKLTFAKDKVIELRFRHQLGEYSEDEFRRHEYDYLSKVDDCQAQWDEVNLALDDYNALIGDDKDFQTRYNFGEPAVAPPPVEIEFEEEEEAEEPAAEYEEFEQFQEDEVDGMRETLEVQFSPEEFEEHTATTEPALLDDEELYEYYQQEETGSTEITEVGFEDQEEETGTVEVPAVDFSTEESSTGIWSGAEIMAAVGGPSEAGGRVEAAPVASLDWGDDDDERESTIVWGGGTPMKSAKTQPKPKTPKHFLFYRDRKNAEVKHLLTQAEVSIGRSQDNDIVLTEGKISRRHAKVQFADGKFSLVDLGSSNGTYVNGAKVNQAVLNPDDEILIGDSVLRFG